MTLMPSKNMVSGRCISSERKLWKELPIHIRAIDEYEAFKRSMKTYFSSTILNCDELDFQTVMDFFNYDEWIFLRFTACCDDMECALNEWLL